MTTAELVSVMTSGQSQPGKQRFASGMATVLISETDVPRRHVRLCVRLEISEDLYTRLHKPDSRNRGGRSPSLQHGADAFIYVEP